MVQARRTFAVFLAAFGVTGLFLYPSSCIELQSNPPSVYCETRLADGPWGWLSAGLLVLAAAVLWSAPWLRTRDRSPRTQRGWIPAQAMRRLGRVGGWLLLGLGGAVLFYSVAGLFRSASDCSWEIGCYEFDFLGGAFREEAFSRIRVVGVTFGVSLLWWGFLELQLEVERLARVLLVGLGFGFVVVVVADPLGYGSTGFGAGQLVGLVIVLALMTLTVLARRRLLERRELLGRLRGYHRDFLFAVMAVSIILGAWVTVLDRIEPRCSGLVRCEHEFLGASVLAASIAAAGMYLAVARWLAAAPPLEDPVHHPAYPTDTTASRP